MDNDEVAILSLENRGSKITVTTVPYYDTSNMDKNIMIDLDHHDYMYLKTLISLMVKRRLKNTNPTLDGVTSI